MLKFLQFVCLLGRYIYQYRYSVAIAIPAILLFSAFHARPSDWTNSATMPPDSLSRIEDTELKETLLEEFRHNRQTDSLINFALSLKGTPYQYGGESPDGFDCSGFIFFVFEQFGHKLLRSSRLQATQGQDIPLDAVQRGDLLFFTGTNVQQRKVGHVGIVISRPDETLQFVHASSNGGVKVSPLEGYYQTRLMFAKRMLKTE